MKRFFDYTFFSIVISCSSALAENGTHLCPDMLESEKLLNEGRRLRVPQSFLNVPNIIKAPEGAFCVVKDYTPARREFDLRESMLWLVKKVDSMPLNTASEREAVGTYAEHFEEVGMYESATKLYGRLITNTLWSQAQERGSLNRYLKGLERAQNYEAVFSSLNNKQYLLAIEHLDKVVENIRTADLNMVMKINLLERLLARTNDVIKKSSSAGSESAVVKAQALKGRIEILKVEYKRSVECLNMADSLNKTAFDLERDGKFAMAEKLYRQALMIKQKNLGLHNTETIAQTVDLARLFAAQGRRTEACKLYESALCELREIPAASQTYLATLESYGDALDRIKEKKKADQIYEEARAYRIKIGVIGNSNASTDAK